MAYKTICKQYGPAPLNHALTTAPLAAIISQTLLFQNFSAPMIAVAGWMLAMLATSREETFAAAAKAMNMDPTRGSRFIQRCQIGGYATPMVAGVLMNAYIAATIPDDSPLWFSAEPDGAVSAQEIFPSQSPL